MKKWLLASFFLFVILSACSSGEKTSTGKSEAAGGNEQAGSDGGFIPSETLDWTIAFGPGGGNDVMARTLINIIEQYDLYPEKMVPENREGGSGAIGWGYLKNQAGNPHAISTTSGSFITTPLQSDAGFTYQDFTHIALMATDDLFLLVPGQSPFETLEDFLNHAKENKVNFGGMGIANTDRMVVTRIAEEAKLANYEYIPYDDNGLVLSDLFAGTTDAIVANPGDIGGQIAAGELKALAFSGKERLENEFADIPTFIELGYDVSVPMPRGVILPPDVSDEAREYWIETMKKVAETPEWEEYIESNGLTEYILYGDEFTEYLEEISSTFERILTDLGVISS